YQNGTLLATVSGSTTSYAVSSLEPATSYTFGVEAGDAAGNWSTSGPSVVVTTAPDFLDSNGHVFEGDIAWLAGAGITKGCDDEGPLFCPESPVTRAQMASFLVRALGLPPASQDFFTDDGGSVHEADINALAQSGITKGCSSNGTLFCPGDRVTRGQMAAFLHRALE
ncbi:MAG: S-layer homology domain-containing protein, partial [Acidimicrobiia bacterium]